MTTWTLVLIISAGLGLEMVTTEGYTTKEACEQAAERAERGVKKHPELDAHATCY